VEGEEDSYPSWTGPAAWRAIESSGMSARVMLSVALEPPSCCNHPFLITKLKLIFTLF
jgi:hypothetical protein